MTTKKELQKELEALKERAIVLENQINSMPDDKPEKFEPKDGDTVWYVDNSGKADSALFNSDAGCYVAYMLKRGLLYPTKEAAEEAEEKRQVLYELSQCTDFVPDWADAIQDKYAICYEPYTNNFCVDFWIDCQFVGVTYFASEAEAQAAIEAVGADRLREVLG